MNNQDITQVLKQKVIVTASARLHMGFFDMNGDLGRLFGSLGLALDVPTTQVEITTIDFEEKPFVTIENNQRLIKVVNNLVNALTIKQTFSIKLQQTIPEHAGLGSGTQLALAVGMGLNQLFKLNLSLAQIAMITNRGKRSGIGIGTFAHGGLVLDGGQGNKSKPPPIIARHDFPENWRILLILDSLEQGVYGDEEINAFNRLPKVELKTAQYLSHIMLMQALPAIAEQDYANFSQAIYALQTATGDYFAPAQGGLFKSKSVATVLAYLYDQQILCAGQSSWGPTGFAVFESDASAVTMLEQLRLHFVHLTNISFQLTNANNSGAKIVLN